MKSKLKFIICGGVYAGLIIFVIHSLLYALLNGVMFYGLRGNRDWHSYQENPAGFIVAFGIEGICLAGLLYPLVLHIRALVFRKP
jgi:hypothetical protein